jgi:uncharacterized protein (TIGR02145 family)
LSQKISIFNSKSTKEVKMAFKKGTFKDPRDGKVYKTVKIGDQVWMAENLAYAAEGSKFYGEGGPLAFQKITLSKTEIKANGKKYGRLYDWKTAKKTCPPGWHLPSKKELEILIAFTGDEKLAGKKLKAKSGWPDPKYGERFNGYKVTSGSGTDDFGFAALPGGFGLSDGRFARVRFEGYWWSRSGLVKDAKKLAYYLNLANNKEDSWLDDGDKNKFLSVRCIKDKN